MNKNSYEGRPRIDPHKVHIERGPAETDLYRHIRVLTDLYLDGQLYQVGFEATLALEDLIERRPITCEGSRRDQSRRPLVHCRIGNLDLGRAMVREGWGSRGIFPPSTARTNKPLRRPT